MILLSPSVIRPITQDELEKSFDLAAYCFPHILSERESLLDFISSIIAQNWALGNYIDGRLSAQLLSIPYTAIVNGTGFSMGGIGLVSSYAESRRGGAVGALLKKSLELQHEHGFGLSYLAPFSYPFYRKYGYEHGFDKLTIKVDTGDLGVFKGTGRVIRGGVEDIPELNEIYNAFINRYSGYVIRTPYMWNRRVANPFSKANPVYTALYLNDKGEKRGYIRYKFTKEAFSVLEIAYLNMDALKGLLHYIFVHDSQFDTVCFEDVPVDFPLRLMLPCPRVEQWLKPGMMSRVVDVKRVVSERTYSCEGTVRVEISDPHCSWNNGCFLFEFGGGHCQVSPVQGPGDAAFSIQRFSQIFCGFLSPAAMLSLDLEGCRIKDEKVLTLLQEAFSSKTTFLADAF